VVEQREELPLVVEGESENHSVFADVTEEEVEGDVDEPWH
jgi:hypothetical protein